MRSFAPVDNRAIVAAATNMVRRRRQKRCSTATAATGIKRRLDAHLKVILHMISRDLESLLMIQGVKNCGAAVSKHKHGSGRCSRDSPCRDRRQHCLEGVAGRQRLVGRRVQRDMPRVLHM